MALRIVYLGKDPLKLARKDTHNGGREGGEVGKRGHCEEGGHDTYILCTVHGVRNAQS